MSCCRVLSAKLSNSQMFWTLKVLNGHSIGACFGPSNGDDPETILSYYNDPWADLCMKLADRTKNISDSGNTIFFKMSLQTLNVLLDCIESIPDKKLHNQIKTFIYRPLRDRKYITHIVIPVLRLKDPNWFEIEDYHPAFEVNVAIDESIPYGRIQEHQDLHNECKT